MSKVKKSAIYWGFAVAGVALGGLALLARKMDRERESEQLNRGEVEFSMAAGDIDIEDWETEVEEPTTEAPATEESEIARCEEKVEEPEIVAEEEMPIVIKVVTCGPLTPRVKPGEDERRELLRKKLDKMIRF